MSILFTNCIWCRHAMVSYNLYVVIVRGQAFWIIRLCQCKYRLVTSLTKYKLLIGKSCSLSVSGQYFSLGLGFTFESSIFIFIFSLRKRTSINKKKEHQHSMHQISRMGNLQSTIYPRSKRTELRSSMRSLVPCLIMCFQTQHIHRACQFPDHLRYCSAPIDLWCPLTPCWLPKDNHYPFSSF